MIGDVFARNPYPAPVWAKDMVIYEVNPRTFTSPQGVGTGDGSGTFVSMAKRLPYLQDLGVNTIWLAGYCQATDHFYGIWSVYATYRPDVLDAGLGDDVAFKALLDEAHAHGIKILLDVISHGVLDASPLVGEHPKWFSSRSWGMTDYNYENPEFREWWVDLWTSYVRRFGVDGFRVDIDLRDADLWDEIVAKCAAEDHEILVMPEHGRYHLGQHDTMAFSPDVATDWAADPLRFTTTQVSCHDNGWLSRPGNYYRVRGSRSAFGYSALMSHRVPLFYAGEEFDAEQHSVPKLSRGLFGAGGPGGWLYGTALDWEEARTPDRAALLADVTALLQARKANSDIINADHEIGEMTALACDPHLPLVPYMRYLPGQGAVVVVGNEQREPVHVSLELPLERAGLSGARCQIRDLLTGETAVLPSGRTVEYRLSVKGDYEPGGGMAVLRIEPQE